MKRFVLLLTLIFMPFLHGFASPSVIEKCEQDDCGNLISASKAYVGLWSKYKVNFGMEKIFVRFPSRPLFTQENGLMIGSATDRQVLYKFIGYFPSVGNIDAGQFFKRELEFVSVYPFAILAQSIYQVDGDWIMDYVAHDTYANVIIKHRSIVTPFNAYTLRAIFPYGQANSFDYFLESFRIQCQCQD